MAKTIIIRDNRTGGVLVLTSTRKNSKVVRLDMHLDSYGFTLEISKDKLKEVLEE